MMVYRLKYSLIFLFLFLGYCTHLSAQQDSVKIVVNDSTGFWHKINWISKDTINGKSVAVFTHNESVAAIIHVYKNGLPHGVWKRFYPSGQLLEKTTYKEGKKSGEYALFDFRGTAVVLGSYKNNLRHGSWNYKQAGISGRYVNGKKEGIWKYSPNGYQDYFYRFKAGELVGDYKIQPPPFLLKD